MLRWPTSNAASTTGITSGADRATAGRSCRGTPCGCHDTPLQLPCRDLVLRVKSCAGEHSGHCISTVPIAHSSAVPNNIVQSRSLRKETSCTASMSTPSRPATCYRHSGMPVLWPQLSNSCPRPDHCPLWSTTDRSQLHYYPHLIPAEGRDVRPKVKSWATLRRSVGRGERANIVIAASRSGFIVLLPGLLNTLPVAFAETAPTSADSILRHAHSASPQPQYVTRLAREDAAAAEHVRAAVKGISIDRIERTMTVALNLAHADERPVKRVLRWRRAFDMCSDVDGRTSFALGEDEDEEALPVEADCKQLECEMKLIRR